MIVSGHAHVAAAPAQLWASLSDPRRLAEQLPEVQELEIADESHFAAVVQAPSALGASVFAMQFSISDRREAEHVRIEAHGLGGENLVELAIELALAPDAAGTEVDWTADVRVRGVLASLVQRALPAIVSEQVTELLTLGAGVA